MRVPTLSVVVPVYEEGENVGPLIEAVRETLGERDDWELLLVDDGSLDDTVERAMAAADGDERVSVVCLARNYGQTQAMQAGFDLSRGERVVTMDGDLQNDPRDIPRLVAKLDEGYTLVAGYRVRRQDGLLLRKIPSWIANRLIARLTGVAVRDNGCSLKAYRRSVLDQLHLYSDMHRFLPALAAATSDARIAEVPVRHHPRTRGRSKYGISRVAKVAADLLTLTMISSFRERPLALFGAAACAASAIGLASIAWSVGRWAMLHGTVSFAYVHPSAGMLWLTLACSLLMLGLVAEEALRASREPGLRSHDVIDT